MRHSPKRQKKPRISKIRGRIFHNKLSFGLHEPPMSSFIGRNVSIYFSSISLKANNCGSLSNHTNDRGNPEDSTSISTDGDFPIFHSPCQYSHMRTMLFLYIPLADCCCALPLRALRKGVCECLLQQCMKRLFYLRGYVNIH